MNALRIAAVIAASFLVGCGGPSYMYAGLGAGENSSAMTSDDYWDDGDATGAKLYGGFRYNIGGNLWGDIRASHHSQWESGEPFDDVAETESDHVYWSVEYHFGVSP